MRILALPAAVLLACFLYPILPQAASWIDRAFRRLHALLLRAFTRKSGETDDSPALLAFVLLIAGASALLGALHPVIEAIAITPLFTGLCVLPGCAATKENLDSGAYTRDIPAYEALVRETCASIAPAFVSGVCAPLLACAIGMPMHLGAALGWTLHILRLPFCAHPLAGRIVSRADRMADAILRVMIILCSGVAGRNPLRTRGKSSKARMMNILGIAGDETDTHAPMAGDISQAAFLCCFASGLLLITLTLIGFSLC